MKARIQKVAELLAALTRRGRSHTNPANVGKQWGRQGGDGGGGGGGKDSSFTSNTSDRNVLPGGWQRWKFPMTCCKKAFECFRVHRTCADSGQGTRNKMQQICIFFHSFLQSRAEDFDALLADFRHRSAKTASNSSTRDWRDFLSSEWVRNSEDKPSMRLCWRREL